jgi:hypothetical protein
MIDWDKINKNFEIDIKNLGIVVDYAENILLTGTRAQRRTDQGKMVTLPCGHRRLQGGDKCCNMQPATSKRAWDPEKGFYQEPCEPRENTQPFSKSFLKKLMHKRHGQSRNNAIKFFTVRLQEEPQFLERAVKEMQEQFPLLKKPEIAEIPTFARSYWFFLEDKKQRIERLQSKLSRRINRGLEKGGARI